MTTEEDIKRVKEILKAKETKIKSLKSIVKRMMSTTTTPYNLYHEAKDAMESRD